MTKWKVCEKKECHMMVRYITRGEITVTAVDETLAIRGLLKRGTNLASLMCSGFGSPEVLVKAGL